MVRPTTVSAASAAVTHAHRKDTSVIGGRWKPILVCYLLGGRKRFGELRRLTPNATERFSFVNWRPTA